MGKVEDFGVSSNDLVVCDSGNVVACTRGEEVVRYPICDEWLERGGGEAVLANSVSTNRGHGGASAGAQTVENRDMKADE
jgi:hypothetical protein